MIAAWKNLESLSARNRGLLASLVIAFAALATYWNSFSVPYLLDDQHSIEANPTIRSLWPIGPVIAPLPGGETVAGRPVLNLSFALNYAISGPAVWSYHAVNLGIHILAGLTLFGFLRRTMLQPTLRPRFGPEASSLALAIAVLWVLHPLQTEAITYTIQRAESLAGLLYLLTLYCFVRGAKAEKNSGWLLLSLLACAVGMGCKEIMASAPVVVLLYDRTFVTGSFLGALRRRRLWYLALASTWLLLAYFILAAGGRGGTTGFFGVAPALAYAKTQGWAIIHYLRLAVWPHPLIFDYGILVIKDPVTITLAGSAVFLLGLATLIGVWRSTLFGFLGCWFFAVLAPSSSVVVVFSQTVAEHRMYLPLAAVMTIIVLGAYEWIGKKTILLIAALACVLGALTIRRNWDYQSEFTIWEDTVAKFPRNPRAQFNLGAISLNRNEFEKAASYLEEAIRLRPDYAEAHNDLGIAFCSTGKMKEGIGEFTKAIKLDPGQPGAHTNLGVALANAGDLPGALSQLEEALRLAPGDVLAQKSLEDVRLRMEKAK